MNFYTLGNLKWDKIKLCNIVLYTTKATQSKFTRLETVKLC